MTRKHGTIRMRARVDGAVTKIEMLINYKIATGLVLNLKTRVLEVKKPQKFVKIVTVSLNGKPVVMSNLSIGSSDDPFLAFKVKGGKAGDTIKVRWEDNLGNWDELSQPVGA
jgi:sulfur-oxidizing protein SoxZ